MDNTEQNNSVMKKKSPLPFIIIGVAALVVVAATVIVLVFLRGGAASKKYSKQLQIADKYMTDMDYKNAVLAYNEAISINPGKADAYLGLADAYLAMGKTKKAIKALEQGLDNVTDEDGREQIQEKLDEIEDEETSEPGPKDKPKEEEVSEVEPSEEPSEPEVPVFTSAEALEYLKKTLDNETEGELHYMDYDYIDTYLMYSMTNREYEGHIVYYMYWGIYRTMGGYALVFDNGDVALDYKSDWNSISSKYKDVFGYDITGGNLDLNDPTFETGGYGED